MRNNSHTNGTKGSNGHSNGNGAPVKRDLLGEHLKAADFHINQGDLQACRTSMENAVEVAPTNVKILSTLGNLCFQMGDFNGAKHHFERVLQIEPQNPVLHAQLATTCQRLGDGEGFTTALQQALTIDPACESALALLAGVHFQGQRYGEAANVYEQLVARNPNTVDWLLPLAKCRFHLGNITGSRELYARVRQLEPGNPVAIEALTFIDNGGARRFSIQDIVRDNPAVHRDHTGKPLTMPISGTVANFIQHHVKEGSRTIETGAGMSTLCFLAQGAIHTAIAPDPTLETRMREYCRAHGMRDDRLTYIAKRSEDVVWGLEGEFDCALIDGGHGFPIPFLDFFYLNKRLKKGGFLIVDDLEIWTGETLAKFLSCERAWKLVVQDGNRSIIFQKVGDAQSTEWTRQEFVVKSSLHPHYMETIIPREVLSAVMNA